MGLYAFGDELIIKEVSSGRLTVQVIDGQAAVFYDGREKALDFGKWGRISISLKHKHLAVHRVVYYYFHRHLDPNLVINHIDGNWHNNHPDNLELVTQGENLLHSYRVLGRLPAKGYAKISFETAEDIRADQRAGATNRQLREKYGLAKSTISYIVNARTRKTA